MCCVCSARLSFVAITRKICNISKVLPLIRLNLIMSKAEMWKSIFVLQYAGNQTHTHGDIHILKYVSNKHKSWKTRTKQHSKSNILKSCQPILEMTRIRFVPESLEVELNAERFYLKKWLVCLGAGISFLVDVIVTALIFWLYSNDGLGSYVSLNVQNIWIIN